jgi:hypothetical protein
MTRNQQAAGGEIERSVVTAIGPAAWQEILSVRNADCGEGRITLRHRLQTS